MPLWGLQPVARPKVTPASAHSAESRTHTCSWYPLLFNCTFIYQRVFFLYQKQLIFSVRLGASISLASAQTFFRSTKVMKQVWLKIAVSIVNYILCLDWNKIWKLKTEHSYLRYLQEMCHRYLRDMEIYNRYLRDIREI